MLMLMHERQAHVGGHEPGALVPDFIAKPFFSAFFSRMLYLFSLMVQIDVALPVGFMCLPAGGHLFGPKRFRIAELTLFL